MSRIDVGEGMRSADIPDGFGHLPDEGTCPVCQARGRVKKDGTMHQHWRYGWSRRNGHPPCDGTNQKPSVLNERRLTRLLVKARDAAADEGVVCEDAPVTGIPQKTEDITDDDVKRIVGWIGRHALPPTLPDTMPEYRTGLALEMVARAIQQDLKHQLSAKQDEDGFAVRMSWNLLVMAASQWNDEPEYPGWKLLLEN